jgi:hypothetical protein
MVRDPHLCSKVLTEPARPSGKVSLGGPQEWVAEQVCFEPAFDAASPISKAELDAIELLLGSELKIFTT